MIFELLANYLFNRALHAYEITYGILSLLVVLQKFLIGLELPIFSRRIKNKFLVFIYIPVTKTSQIITPTRNNDPARRNL